MQATHTTRARARAVAAFGLVTTLCLPAAVTAQGNNPPSPVRTFVGAGVVLTSTNRPDRLQDAVDNAREQTWKVELGAALTRRLSVGVEVYGLSRVILTSAHPSSRFSTAHAERPILGTLRLRAFGRGRIGIDGVVGAGVLYQRARVYDSACNGGKCFVQQLEAPTKSAAYTWGADGSWAVIRHVTLAPAIRFFHLQRQSFADASSWKLTEMSGTRVAFELNSRVGW